MSRLYTCFVGALMLLSLVAMAEVSEQLDYSYYEVTDVNSVVDLRPQLNNASPVRHKGQIFHARTDWDVDWRFDWEQADDNRCAISDVRVSVDAVILLPSLTSEDAEAQRQFNDYVRLLQVHEQGHYMIAMQAANAIVRHLERLHGPCEVIEDQANKLALVLLDEYTGREKLYDEVTHHGLQQDAWQW